MCADTKTRSTIRSIADPGVDVERRNDQSGDTLSQDSGVA